MITTEQLLILQPLTWIESWWKMWRITRFKIQIPWDTSLCLRISWNKIKKTPICFVYYLVIHHILCTKIWENLPTTCDKKKDVQPQNQACHLFKIQMAPNGSQSLPENDYVFSGKYPHLISTVNHLWTTVRCFLVLFPESNWPKNLQSTREKKQHNVTTEQLLWKPLVTLMVLHLPPYEKRLRKNAAADHLKCATTGGKKSREHSTGKISKYTRNKLRGTRWNSRHIFWGLFTTLDAGKSW